MSDKGKTIVWLGIVGGLIAVLIFLYYREVHMPIWLTHPYDVTIEKGNAWINAYVGKEKEISIPDRILWAKVTGIGEDAFEELGTDVVILNVPQSVTSIRRLYHYESHSYYTIFPEGEMLLYEYKGEEKKVEIPENVWGREVAIVGYYSFSGTDIEEVIIPKSVICIEPGAFKDCKYLKQVKLPMQLESIQNSAFHSSGVEEIEVPESVKEIGDYAFKDSNLVVISGLENVEYIGDLAFRGTPWEDSIEGEFICVGDIMYLYRGENAEVVIPTNIKEIRGAFCRDEEDVYPIKIRRVYVSETVESISPASFLGQTEVEVYIPETVKNLGVKELIDPSINYLRSIFGFEGYGTIVTTAGSPAEAYAIEEGIDYRIISKKQMQQEMENALKRQIEGANER